MNNSEIAQDSIDRAKEFGRKKDGQISLAVDSIIADFTDRRGLRQEWENIDEDVKNDIIEVWECIMRNIFHL
jgi:hypothetical protein